MCPVCGTITDARPGEPTGMHQRPDGSREQCPGSGRPALPEPGL
jgi:hypothetical protein